MKAVIESMLWLRLSDWSRSTVAELKDRFTVTPSIKVEEGELLPTPIEQFIESKGRIGLPSYAGLQWARQAGCSIVDRTTLVEDTRLHTCAIPTPRNKEQEKFFDDILRVLRKSRYLLAQAGTGTGKTVAALNAAAELGQKTLVVVPTRRIALQWKKQVTRQLGISAKYVGSVQSGVADYKNKTIVVAVVHNLTDTRFPEDFYKAFGFVVYDEVHNYGARWFSKSLRKFSAKYQLALTATAYRSDKCDVIFKNKFGPVRVKAENQPMPATCYVCNISYPFTKERDYLNGIRRRESLMYALRRKKSRNAQIVKLTKDLWARGRTVLVIADSTKHLQSLASDLSKLGVPRSEIGLYARSYYVGKKKKVIGQGYLDRIEQTKSVFFATYGMMREAVDIPRMDAGVEASPRADNVQAIGRIRRWLEEANKLTPVWFSFVDNGIDTLESMAYARFDKFSKVGVTVKQWNGELAA